MFGTVTKYFRDRGYGFIRGEDNNVYFVHASKLNGEYIDIDYFVNFKPYRNERSDYCAKNISVIESNERRRDNDKQNKQHG